MMPTEYNPNAAAERLMYQAEGWGEQGEEWKKVASDIRIVIGCLRMYSERLSEFQIAPSPATVENLESRILAVLKASDKPLKASAVAAKLEASTADVVRALRPMEADRRVKVSVIRTWRHYTAK